MPSLSPSSVSYVPEPLPSQLVRLVTNPASMDRTDVQESQHPGLVRTRAYLSQVLQGDGNPTCPFVTHIEDANGYYVRMVSDFLSTVSIPKIAEELRREFRRLSPRHTRSDQPVDPVTTVAAFAQEDAIGKDFFTQLDVHRNSLRPSFLEEGLMLAHMHPHHPRGSASARHAEPGDDPLYCADIPLLMVRRMHRQDEVFMQTRRARAAYKKFFGAPHERKYSVGELDAGRFGARFHPMTGVPLSELHYDSQERCFFGLAHSCYGGSYRDYHPRISDGCPRSSEELVFPHSKFDPFTGVPLLEESPQS